LRRSFALIVRLVGRFGRRRGGLGRSRRRDMNRRGWPRLSHGRRRRFWRFARRSRTRGAGLGLPLGHGLLLRRPLLGGLGLRRGPLTRLLLSCGAGLLLRRGLLG
jgi:hypothetical protein